ncbi:MAG: prenyltransferase/squalene oxidase repeat-containing protein [Bryobacteraceae bacterium]
MASLPASTNPILASRLEFLAKTQNPDGGWGYFPGKQSWIEPTAWSAIALHGHPASAQAWQRLLSWQNQDGSWRPSQDVNVSSWATALCVIIGHLRNEFGEPYKRGLHWLLTTHDAESTAYYRALGKIGYEVGRDPAHPAWPWKPGDSSWIEPTAHTLLALKLAGKRLKIQEITERIALGEASIMDQRCQDGGWNYGNRQVLKVYLPSYPETTGIALVGLQNFDAEIIRPSVEKARALLGERQGRMASAWLSIALQMHGKEAPASTHPDVAPNGDILETALEAIAAPGGACHLLKTGGAA